VPTPWLHAKPAKRRSGALRALGFSRPSRPNPGGLGALSSGSDGRRWSPRSRQRRARWRGRPREPRLRVFRMSTPRRATLDRRRGPRLLRSTRVRRRARATCRSTSPGSSQSARRSRRWVGRRIPGSLHPPWASTRSDVSRALRAGRPVPPMRSDRRRTVARGRTSERRSAPAKARSPGSPSARRVGRAKPEASGSRTGTVSPSGASVISTASATWTASAIWMALLPEAGDRRIGVGQPFDRDRDGCEGGECHHSRGHRDRLDAPIRFPPASHRNPPTRRPPWQRPARFGSYRGRELRTTLRRIRPRSADPAARADFGLAPWLRA
jgi:hypothetical protein